MKKLTKLTLGTAAALAVLVALSLAGRSDYEEAVASRQRYCEMVGAGYWPDYQGDYEACE